MPVVFFSKHIEGKQHENKTARLRSDISEKTWEVKTDGRRLTEGWKEFVKAHDLRIGDMIIFKYEGDMVFTLTPFGPSGCKIQYAHSHIKEEDANEDENDMENQHNTSKGLREMNLKPTSEPESFVSFEYCFVANVTASNLKVDTIRLPKEAARSKALNRRCHKIKLVNKEGNSWTLKLGFRESEETYYMTGGWKNFCRENRHKVGDQITFNLVGDGKSTPLLCICLEEV